MNWFVVTGLLFLAVLSGCAGHSVVPRGNSLTFSLRIPGATRVQLASSVDNFTLHDAVRNSSGVWQVTVPTSSPGEVQYFYIVDGGAYLPECRLRETDDFGSENCLYQPAL